MPDQNTLNIAALILAGLLGCAGLLLAAGQLFHAVKQTRGTESKGQAEEAKYYSERLERLIIEDQRIRREEIEALRMMTEEMRRGREEQFAMHRDNIEVQERSFREIRDVLWDRRR